MLECALHPLDFFSLFPYVVKRNRTLSHYYLCIINLKGNFWVGKQFYRGILRLGLEIFETITKSGKEKILYMDFRNTVPSYLPNYFRNFSELSDSRMQNGIRQEMRAEIFSW